MRLTLFVIVLMIVQLSISQTTYPKIVKIRDSVFVLLKPQQLVELDVLRAKYVSCKKEIKLDSIRFKKYEEMLAKKDSVINIQGVALELSETDKKNLKDNIKKLNRSLKFEKKKKYLVGGSFLVIFGALKYFKVF